MNQKLLDNEQAYYSQISRKNSQYVKRKVPEARHNMSIDYATSDKKPKRIYFTSDQIKRHPKINLPVRKNIKMSAFKISSKSKDRLKLRSNMFQKIEFAHEIKQHETSFDAGVRLIKIPEKKVHSHSEPRRHMLNDGKFSKL